MFCRKCGKEIVDDSEWCMYCGEKVCTSKQKNIDCINNDNSKKLDTEITSKDWNLSQIKNKVNDQVKTKDRINNNHISAAEKVINSNIERKNNSNKKELKNSYLIGGLSCNLLLNWIFNIIIKVSPDNFVFTMISLIFNVVVVMYLFYIYPFDICNKDKFQINRFNISELNSISFRNGLFGGLWGILLNYNCKNGKRGYSCFVIGSLVIIAEILVLIISFS